MPHSLRVRLKNLQRKGELTEKDIDRIFKALEQEPCDDAISRQAEIDDFTAWREKLAYSFSEDYSGVHLLDSAISIIRKMPSVQPKKTGHWIDRVVEECAEYDAIRWKCSECGQLSCCKSKFCGDCGAKMVEPTCDTCEYSTAAFNPCNACEDKSEYKPQESEDV